MADKTITQLTEITSANAANDFLPVVDTSAVKTKKIKLTNLPMSNAEIDQSYSFTTDFSSGNERTQNLGIIAENKFLNDTNLQSIYIGSNVRSIRKNAFLNCSNLVNVTMSDSVESIGDLAFNICTSLTSIDISDRATSIGNQAFNSCTSLTRATTGGSLTTIGTNAFISCTSLTSVTIGESVTSIGAGAFESCTSLSSVTIPGSVTLIGSRAFYDCTALSTIISLATDAPSVVTNSFSNVSASTITVPAGATASYVAAGTNGKYGGLTIAELAGA